MEIYNIKAWMTSTIYENCFHGFDKKDDQRNQGVNIILILNNVPHHMYDAQLKNVKL